MNPLALRSRERCTTGCSLLDAALGGGGIVCGCVTELVGESGVAKTQLSLQLLVTVQFPVALGGLGGSALYIPTEGYFPGRRLRQIAKGLQLSRGLGFDPCKNVFVEPVESIDGLFALFDRIELVFDDQKDAMPVRLLLIDSVAALFRSEFENNRAEMVVRAGILFQLAAKLKAFAHRHNLAVVVTNQVMDCVDGGSRIQIGNLVELESSGRKVAPALGLSWAHCVNTRLLLSRTDFVRLPESARINLTESGKRQRPFCELPENAACKERKQGDAVFCNAQFDPAGQVQECQPASGAPQPLDGGSEMLLEKFTRNLAPVDDDNEIQTSRKRVLHVLFAPHIPHNSCEFVVDENGVHGVPPRAGHLYREIT